MFANIFPFLRWREGYTKEAFRVDCLAGVTAALVLIPQSMAYAQLAGMPAYYGLYAALLPPLVAALFGSSNQLATGPVAVVSLMTAASLEPLALAGSSGYIAYAILLAFMVGLFQFLLGVLRLGLVVNFLSHPVVNGFTNAAAIIIASSQLSKIFGVYVDKADHHYETIFRVIESALNYTHWPAFEMAIIAIAIMYSLKRISPKLPSVLVAVVVTTCFSWFTGFHHDAAVDISAIQSPAVKEAIIEFNTVLSDTDVVVLERAALGQKLDAAKQLNDEQGVLVAENGLSLVALKMAKQKEKQHVLRSYLRSQVFDGVLDSDEGLVLYLRGQGPAGAETDGRPWRIRVGNAPLNTSVLSIMGGGDVVGTIPSGIPSLSVPALDLKVMLQLLPFAIVISLLGFMEAISIAKAMAAKTGQRLDPNQELIGQGLANMVGAIGSSYPTSGSFSRSAVNLQAGAATGLSSVFTSVVVGLVLMFFTPLLYHLPQAVLASVIMMAVIGLVNLSGFAHAWKAQKYDGIISVVTFLCTLAFAPHLDKGIMVGVVLSLAVFLFQSMRPKIHVEQGAAQEAMPRGALMPLDGAEKSAVVRFNGPMFFANASYLEEQITGKVLSDTELRHIVIDASGVSDIDASGEEALHLIVERLRSEGRELSLYGVNSNVWSVLERTGLLETIGSGRVHASVSDVGEEYEEGPSEPALQTV